MPSVPFQVCNVIMQSCDVGSTKMQSFQSHVQFENSAHPKFFVESLNPLSPLGLQTPYFLVDVLSNKSCGHSETKPGPTRSPKEFLDSDSGAWTLQGGLGGRLWVRLRTLELEKKQICGS